MTLPVLRSPTAEAWELLRPVERLHQLLESTGAWTPLVDVAETGDAYLVEMKVPGVRRRDLDVEVAAGELRITGEIVEKERAGWFRRRTRRVGRFAYRATLPDDIEAGRISADLAGGVLTVRVPKAAHARARRIPVSVG